MASVACERCAKDIRADYLFDDLHPLRPSCVDLLSLWYPEEGLCRAPRDAEDIRQGRVVLGR